MPTDPVSEPIDEDEEFAALAGTDVRKKSLMERIREACAALSDDDEDAHNGIVYRDGITACLVRIDLDDENLDSYD